MKDPLAALHAIGNANAILTYEIGQLHNGARLDKLKPELERLQAALSRVNALLIMDPDTKVTFETMDDVDYAELRREDQELNELVQLPPTEVVVQVVAEPRDTRHIAKDLADAVTGSYLALSGTNGVVLDMSAHLTARLALIDPYNEGYPYELDETEGALD